MKKLVNTKNLSYLDWLEYRRKGIGGSDASAICGFNPWKSAYAVYLDKTGQVPDIIEDTERLRVGRDLEDYVAKRFEEAAGKKVRRNNFMLQHDEYDFIVANIDREIVGERAILECKTTNSYAKKNWADGVPLHYQFQCHHYMLVTGFERCYVAVLIGNEEFKHYTIERDAETLEMLLKAEVEFWENNVLKGEAPAPDGSSSYDQMLLEKYVGGNDEVLDLPDNLTATFERLDTIKELQKELKQERAQHEQEIKKALGNHETAYIHERKITWKNSTRTTFDSKEFKKDMPELYEKYSVTTNTRTLRV